MKALVTGSHGTVGKVLCGVLTERGVSVAAWDRKSVPIDHYQAMEDYVKSERPDVLFHLAVASSPTGLANEGWRVNYDWSSELAWICRVLGIQFVFTSTAMVFSDNNQGPHYKDSVPDASEGYGYEKRKAEERVFYQKPDAKVVRLGWQIGSMPDTNNMVDYLERSMREKGEIKASGKWLPACSFLNDTATALADIGFYRTGGLYMLDSNNGYSFFDIVQALKSHLNRKDWVVVRDDSFVYDQRMIDPDYPMPQLTRRLKKLTRTED